MEELIKDGIKICKICHVPIKGHNKIGCHETDIREVLATEIKTMTHADLTQAILDPYHLLMDIRLYKDKLKVINLET